MYQALTSGSTKGKSGQRWQWDAGDTIPDAEKGELDHVESVFWNEDLDKEEDSEEPEGKTSKEQENPLPEDLPGRDDFFEEGIESTDEIKQMDDPTEVNGIGPKTAKDLAEWFAEQDN